MEGPNLCTMETAKDSKFDICDASRAKIVIKPRCREFARKQRESKSISTLMKGRATAQAEEANSSEKRGDAPNKTPTKPKGSYTGYRGVIESRVGKPTNRLTPENMPSAKSSPPRPSYFVPVETSAVLPSFVPPEPFHCGQCADPSNCSSCRLIGLIDQFCSVHDQFMDRYRRRQAEMQISGQPCYVTADFKS